MDWYIDFNIYYTILLIFYSLSEHITIIYSALDSVPSDEGK